jgi:ESCRT-I complex subunit VPS28
MRSKFPCNARSQLTSDTCTVHLSSNIRWTVPAHTKGYSVQARQRPCSINRRVYAQYTCSSVANLLHSDDRGEGVLVAETVQHFITAMDSIKLEQRAVDELHPLISDLMNSLTRIPGLPPTFFGLEKFRNW